MEGQRFQIEKILKNREGTLRYGWNQTQKMPHVSEFNKFFSHYALRGWKRPKITINSKLTRI